MIQHSTHRLAEIKDKIKYIIDRYKNYSGIEVEIDIIKRELSECLPNEMAEYIVLKNLLGEL